MTKYGPAEFALSISSLGPFESAPQVAVACSGGADSMALTLLADAWAREAGGRATALIVDHAMRDAMNVCAVAFPPDVDELAMAGLTALPGTHVKSPRIAEAPAALECRRYVTLEVGRSREIILGEVLGHKVQGLKNMNEAIRPAIYDQPMLDDKVVVGDEEAFETTRRLVLREGLL
ncbi:MAG: flavin reductase, partial [Pseudomonadota bacterium]